MTKAFSIINILIVVGLVAFGYLTYNDFIKNKNINTDKGIFNPQANIASSSSSGSLTEDNPVASSVQKKSISPTVSSSSVSVSGKTTAVNNSSPSVVKSVSSTDNGYYKNSIYKYEITCPADWPLRAQSADNVSIGTVPPKNGNGAVTIEVSQGNEDYEIEQMKAEADKYSGIISFTEKTITLAGVAGQEYTLSNNVSGLKNFYIMIQKNNLSYLIKYSYESDSFVKQVEAALKTFRFTN